MADPSPQGAKSADPESGPRRAGRIGRRIALALWALAMLYIVVVGFASVVPQVFFREPEGTDAQAARLADEGTECEAEAEALMDGLLERAGEHVAEVRPAATLAPYFHRWDARHAAYLRHCGESSSAADLRRLRYRLELTLRRFSREEGAIVHRLDRR